MLQNWEHGVILGKEIKILFYVGTFGFRWISSVSSSSFIRGMILL
jgi:hypothetical protein